MQPNEFPEVILELLAVHDGLGRMGFRDVDNIYVDVDGRLPKVILKVGVKACHITVKKPLGMTKGEFESKWYAAATAFNELWKDSTRDEIWKKSMIRRNLDQVVGAIKKAGIRVPLEDEMRYGRKQRLKRLGGEYTYNDD